MDKLLQALHGCGFQQFLAQVVAKLIGHDIVQEVGHYVDESSR